MSPCESELFLRKRLKELRTVTHLTQAQVSELAGISYDYYQNIEQGKRTNVSIRLVEKLGKVYGLSICELFSPATPKIKLKTKSIPPPHYKRRK